MASKAAKRRTSSKPVNKAAPDAKAAADAPPAAKDTAAPEGPPVPTSAEPRAANSEVRLASSPDGGSDLSIPRVVWIIVAVGVLIRLFGAFRWGMWLDEVQNQPIIVGGLSRIFRTAHWAHFLTQWPFVAVADHNQLAMRAPSLIFGAMSVPLGFVTARRLFNERVGVLFALFLSLGTYFIVYSVDANYYSHMMFWVIAALYCYGRASSGFNPLKLAPLIPIALLAFFVHPFSAIFFGLLFVYLPLDLVLHDTYFRNYPSLRRFTETPRKRAIGAAALLGATGLALVALVFFGGWGSRALETARKFIGMLEFGKTPTNVAFSFAFVESIFRRFGPAFLDIGSANSGPVRFINLILFALFVVGGALSARRNRLVPVLFFLPFVVSFGLIFNLDAKRAFSIRYFSYLAPLYWLGIALAVEAAVSKIASRWPVRGTRWGSGALPHICAGLGLLAFSFPQYGHMLFHEYGNWNKVMGVIAPHIQPKEPFVYTNWPEHAIIPYYLEKHGIKGNPRNRLFYHSDRDKFTEADLKDICYGTPSLWFVKSWSNPQSVNALIWAAASMEKVVESPNIFMPENNATVYHWSMGGRFVYPPRILQYDPSSGGAKAEARDFSEFFLFDKTMDYEVRLYGAKPDPAAVEVVLDEAAQILEGFEAGDKAGLKFRARIEQGRHRIQISSKEPKPLGLQRVVIIPRYDEDRIFIPACNASDIYPSLYTLTPKIDNEYVLRLVRNTFASYRMGLAEGGLYRIRMEGRRNGESDVTPVWIEIRFDGRLAGLFAFDNAGDTWAAKSFAYPLAAGDRLLTVRFVNERNLTRDAPETNRDAFVRSISLEPVKPDEPVVDDRVFTPDESPSPVSLIPQPGSDRTWEMTLAEKLETKLLPAGGYNNAPMFTATLPRDSAGVLLKSAIMRVPPSGIIYHSSMLRAQNLNNHSMNVQTILYDEAGRELGLILANQEGITGTTDWVRFVQVETLPDSIASYRIVMWVYPNGRRPSAENGVVMFSEPQLENTQ